MAARSHRGRRRRLNRLPPAARRATPSAALASPLSGHQQAPATRRPVPWTDVLVTGLAPAIWGSTYIVTTELLPPDRPFTAALLRVLPAGILLTLYAWSLPRRSDWRRLALLSALNIGFFQALLFVAAYSLPGGLAAVVGAIQPLLMMGLVWAVDGRQPGPWPWPRAPRAWGAWPRSCCRRIRGGIRSASQRHWPARPAWQPAPSWPGAGVPKCPCWHSPVGSCWAAA